jgi:peptidoglycan-associated lipoprotein
MRIMKAPAILLAAVLMTGLTTGCKKKVAVAAPAAPPPAVQPAPPRAPTASLVAEPRTIERGQSATLRWSTTGATEVDISSPDAAEVDISSLGSVGVEGNRSVEPSESTTYTLTATGPGGTVTATAKVNVTVPSPPPAPTPALSAKSLAERVDTELADAYFDLDKSDIRDDAQAVLRSDANALRSIFADFPDAVLYLEGHCDERGSAEYNLALGDRRTLAAGAFLETLGMNTSRLQPISEGKEKPQCTEATEECWQRNRRVHFSASGDTSQKPRSTAGASSGETKGTGVLPGPSL